MIKSPFASFCTVAGFGSVTFAATAASIVPFATVNENCPAVVAATSSRCFVPFSEMLTPVFSLYVFVTATVVVSWSVTFALILLPFV